MSRQTRFLSHEKFQSYPLLGWLLRLADVIPVSHERSREAIRSAVAHARRGELVGVFPEGTLSRDGSVAEFQSGYALIAHKVNVPIVPVCLDGLWGSIFSYTGGCFFLEAAAHIPAPCGYPCG